MEQSPLPCPSPASCPGPSWSFSSDRTSPKSTSLLRNSPKSTNLLSGTLNSSSFSTQKNQTLGSSYASEPSVQEIPCPGTTTVSSPKGNGTGKASLSLHSEMSFNSSWSEKAGVRSTGNHPLLERPLTSTALRAPSRAPAGLPAEDTQAVNDADLDLDHFDIDDFDDDWEDLVNVSAPETQPYQPIREGPPARSLLSKIMSRAKGPAAVSSPAAPKSGFSVAAKNPSGESCS